MVLLTGPVKQSSDPRPMELAFVVLDTLKRERIVLISKAVSWLLRALVEHHADVVGSYVDSNEGVLPAIATRETRVKLRTGTKSGTPSRR